MLPRERVLESLSFREPDRVPIYLWVFNQPGVIDDIRAKHGSFEAFCDALELDVTQAFPSAGMTSPAAPPPGADNLADPTYGRCYTLEEALALPFRDPDDAAIYEGIRTEIAHHQGRRGRAVFIQTPGVFEQSNSFLGLTGQLMELALRPELLRRFHERVARWAARYAENCLDLGADVIHISDDWGGQRSLLFRPESWWEVIRPSAQITCDAVRAKGGLLSLHSDGDITAVLDGVAELGFRVFHPCQESAGMDPVAVKRQYAGRLGLYGGLDVQTVLGRGLARGALADEVRRILRALGPGGGYVFCSSHMVQPGTELDEVEFAYQVAREEAARVVGGAA